MDEPNVIVMKSKSMFFKEALCVCLTTLLLAQYARMETIVSSDVVELRDVLPLLGIRTWSYNLDPTGEMSAVQMDIVRGKLDDSGTWQEEVLLSLSKNTRDGRDPLRMSVSIMSDVLWGSIASNGLRAHFDIDQHDSWVFFDVYGAGERVEEGFRLAARYERPEARQLKIEDEYLVEWLEVRVSLE